MFAIFISRINDMRNVKKQDPLGKVINILEMGDRFVKVSNMHIGEEKDGVCEARFTLSTYLFVGEKSATPTPAKKVEQG